MMQRRRDGVALMECKPKYLKLKSRLTPSQDRMRAEFRPKFDDCLHAVAIVADLPASAIVARGRLQHIVVARQILVETAMQVTPLSHCEVARRMGRDHTTILYARSVLATLVQAGDMEIARYIDDAIAQAIAVAQKRREGEQRIARLTLDDVARMIYMDRRRRASA